ncbi:class I SAM-dependent methyltransferase [Chryseobacterium sp. Bi04]|uniref:class I SAM-dependent methyltransferase n=1 Tax=Chryseobacterium sp. Bi04 TaxID=2822345 RepID=UPI001DA8E1EB|nr:class I SAM-dependent methyltransferase [Chryseobacterium sp. Bi04]CAH0191639.1 Ubiquinone/menaquinone biosynthesis C-methyltransferase UbiE [Chryseobacterium sp. Bi04]
MNLIDPSIDSFYTKRQEENRLSTGLGPLEFERTKILINCYLNKSSHIADIGGGTGHYAQWLAGMGHSVTLIDPVKKHIEQAKKRSARGFQFTCLHGEARNLPLSDLSQELVLLHGPLYHLQQLDERLAALKEAGRILKKGGVLLGFAITHSASAIAALQSGLIHDQKLFAMCISELQSGDHFPPENYPLMLPKGFCHRPSDLIEEFEMAGFEQLDVLPVEGIAWLDGNFFESWAEMTKRNKLLELIKLTEQDRELLCFSPHIMLAEKK